MRESSAAPFHWSVATDFRLLWQEHGLQCPLEADDRPGELVGCNRGREVRRWSAPGRPTLYCKHYWHAPGRSAAAAEGRILAELADRKLPAAKVVAVAERVDGQSILVLEELPGKPLDEVLREAQSPGLRAQLVRNLGELLVRLHDRGVAHRQLFSWHLLALQGELFLLDVADARFYRRSRGTPLFERSRDLGALFATLSLEALTSADRFRLLRSYGFSSPALRRLLPLVRRQQIRFHRKGRLPRSCGWSEILAGDERLAVHDRVQEPLRSTSSLEGWLAPLSALRLRERDGRVNLQWNQPPDAQSTAAWYGKRFERGSRLRRPPAWREMEAHRSLEWLGLPVPEVMAAGRRRHGASVLWTAGVDPGTTLLEFLKDLPAGHDGRRRRILRRIMALVRRLHRAGFCHRDLYFDHFLRRGEGVEDWVLIDLGRLEQHPRLPLRRRIRDLASLDYSARLAGLSRSDRRRAWLCYGWHGSANLLPAVLRKADAIEARQRRKGLYSGPPAS